MRQQEGRTSSCPLLENVFLGKLRGFKYPPLEQENKLLQAFFQLQLHPLTHKQVIYIVHFIQQDLQAGNNHVQEVVVFPYLLSKLEVKVELNSSNGTTPTSHQIRDTRDGIFSTKCSKVFFDGKHHQHTLHYSDHYSQAMLQWLSTHPTNPRRTCFMLPLLPRISGSYHIPFFPLYVGGSENSERATYQSELQKYQCYAKSDSAISSESSARELLDLLTSRHLSTHCSKHQRLLLQEGILLDLSAGVVDAEAESLVRLCANELSLAYVTIDARLLVMESSKLSPILQHSIVSTDYKYDNIWNISTIEELSRVLVSCSPCIVHVVHADAVLKYDQPASEEEAHQAAPEDLKHVYQDKLQFAIEKVLLLLEELLHKDSTHPSEQTMSNLATLVISSRCQAQLTHTMQSYFPTTVCLQASECASQSKVSSQYHGLLIKKSVLEMLQTVVEASGWNFISSLHSSSATSDSVNIGHLSHPAKMILHAAIYCAFERNYHQEQALSRGPPFVVGSNCNRKLVVHRRDLRQALEQLQHYCQFITSEAQSAKGKKTSNNNNGGSSKVTPVHWADIGGLERVRSEIMDVLELPIKYPHLFPVGSPRRHGVLLYGPPGTGKTLVAKAVATECNMNFLSVKGPELLDSYVGESERNVRELFHQAKEKAPTILFFDEIDSLAPKKAKSGSESGGGVMDRIVSQLLAEMDALGDMTGANGQHGVFVIAATNRPDLLEPALLRPGRFDRRIYLGTNTSVTAIASILRAQTRKFQLAADINFEKLADVLINQNKFNTPVSPVKKAFPYSTPTKKPIGYTGADLGAVSSKAYSHALERKLQLIKDNFNQTKESTETDDDAHLWKMQHYMNDLPEDEVAVVVSQEDFLYAVRDSKPSTSVELISYYEQLEKKFDSSA